MKKVHIKSAIPIYIAAAIWLVVGLIFPKLLMKLPGLLLTAALSVGGYFAGSVLFPGREVEQKITTGDAAVDQEIEVARQRLENLRKANGHPGSADHPEPGPHVRIRPTDLQRVEPRPEEGRAGAALYELLSAHL